MNFLYYLKIAAAIGTILTGLYSLIFPRKIEGFTGLQANSGRALTEIRAVLGAFFIGLGGAAIYLDDPEAFVLLGITYLTVGIVRTISMFLDRSVVSSNIISIIVEVAFGIILIL